MMAPDRIPTRYASAFDLPTFVEMRQQMQAMKMLSLLKPSIRPELKKLEATLNELASLIDRFYDRLGARNWLFTSNLNTSHVSEICALNSLAEQEAAFIALHQDGNTLSFMVRRLWGHPGMRQRMPLLEAALEEYQAGRYSGMIHVLISVMDGFVNDFETNPRRGLHARDGDDMTAWDSVISHHKGLAHVHETVFRKGFYKLSTDEVFELYRHGIVHGTLTNFANVVVATKAWNYLSLWPTGQRPDKRQPDNRSPSRPGRKCGATQSSWGRRSVPSALGRGETSPRARTDLTPNPYTEPARPFSLSGSSATTGLCARSWASSAPLRCGPSLARSKSSTDPSS